MNSVLLRTSSRLAASSPSTHEVACIVLVTAAARLVDRGIVWNARPWVCGTIVVAVLAFVYASVGKGEVLHYLGWIRPRRAIYWLYAPAAGVCGAAVVILAMRLAGKGLGHAPTSTLLYGATLGPVIEEAFYRGVAFSVVYVVCCSLRFPEAWRVIVPVVGTAAFFAASHKAAGFLPLLLIFVMGVAYGVMRWRSHSTATSALMHAAYNLTIAAVMFRS